MENPFPLARMKDSLKNAISLDRKATSIRISIWKKMKKTKIKFFKKYWPPSKCNIGFKKVWMKQYRFHQTENPLPLAVIKDY